jgi:hypothetical protein
LWPACAVKYGLGLGALVGGGVVARVFVSHASKDRECAGQLREWLVAEHHRVFLDQDPGDGHRGG